MPEKFLFFSETMRFFAFFLFFSEAWKSQVETAYSQTDIPDKAGMGKIGGEEI
jgi:hypothetical protein